MSANKIYRKEDIIKMGSEVVNAGWGPNGADTRLLWGSAWTIHKHELHKLQCAWMGLLSMGGR